MKKVYIIILAIAALALSAVSCDIYPTDQELVESELDYVRGEADLDGCYDVYFPTQEASKDHTFDPTAEPKLTVIVARANTKGDIVVPFTVSATPDNVFNIGEIKFADGQSETSIEIEFPTAVNGTKYDCNIQLSGDEFVSKYSDKASSLKFSVLRVEWTYILNPKTKENSIFTFTEEFFGQVTGVPSHKATIKYYETDGVRYCVAECLDGTGIWSDDQNTTLSFIWYPDTKNNIGGEAVQVQEQYLGYDYNDGNWISVPEEVAAAPMYVYDWYNYWIMRGYTPEELFGGFLEDFEGEGDPDGAYPACYYDGMGGFYFNLKYYIPGLGGWTDKTYDVIAIGEGFTRVDYSLEASYDYPEDGILPVYFEAGADVVTIKYATAEGELTPSQILHLGEDVAAGTAEGIEEYSDFYFDEEEAKNYGAVGLEFEESGMYTFVAVGFDKDGNAQESSSFSFQYVAADDESFDVDFRAGLEATPERFGDAYDEYSTLGFWLAGSDITDVKYGIYKTADLEKYGLDVLVDDVRSGKSATEALLEQVNAPGGYASVVTKLADGVSYTLVAWATNGAKSKVAYATYATEKYPETWHSLGTGLYTEDFMTTFFSVENLTYEVEIEESDDTPGRIRLVNPYGEAYPYNDPGDWDDSRDWYMIIETSDPDHVFIRPQEMGLDWGYGNLTIASNAGAYIDEHSVEEIEAAGIQFGTLKDGVITFPAEELLICLPDYSSNFYYANLNGAFEVIMPSVYKKEAAPAMAPAKASKAVSVSADVACSAIRSYGAPSGLTYERAPQIVDSKASSVAPKVSEKSASASMICTKCPSRR